MADSDADVGRALAQLTSDAVFTADEQGAITSCNPAAERLVGWREADLLHQPLSVIVPGDPTDGNGSLRDRLTRGETIRDVDTSLRRRDDTLVAVTLAAQAVRSPHGEIESLLLVSQDSGRRSEAERAARHLAAIVASSDDAVISKDLDGIVTSWNAAAERIFGYTAAEIVGLSIRTVIPPDRQQEEDNVLARIRRGERVQHFETVRQRKDGAMVSVSLTISPIHDADGKVIGASKTARDITAMLESQAERLRLLQENALVTETLNQVGSVVASGLDRDTIVQAVTDAATELTTAQFGAFFYNVTNEKGEAYTLYTISGVPREAFARFPMPRNTEVFEPTFRGTGIVRSDDITRDPRYGHNAPHHGMPEGHLPVRSYLAVPVKDRSGHILGGLFFGHSTIGRFEARHERLASGIAAWASVALENARLYDAAQDANRVKDEFLATLSHELRTPLNAILGYARMLRSGIVAPERQQRAVETIERNATSLTQIVEDVLDVSRIVSGKLRLNVQVVEIPQVIRHAVDAVLPAADAKGIRLETIIDPQATPISGDPERLQQVFWNLLSNAVKFTTRGGKIQVRLERVDSHIEMTCSDTGVGIAAEFLPHIFERFRQADAGISRERGGLGLGLAIARQLVENHGGTIHVASGGVGQGSTFRVKLPLMIVHPMSRPESRVHPTSPRTGVDIALPDLRGMRIVAVDDDGDALALVSEILEAAGAIVTTANSAADALAALEAMVPDVIVADIGMPVMDGLVFITRVRHHSDPKLRGVPAAALTAYARSDDRVKAMRAGFQLHLAKPIDPAELLAAVAALGGAGKESRRGVAPAANADGVGDHTDEADR